MDLRMAICDDEASALEHTRLLAQAWAEQAGHAARIETFLTAEAFLIQYEEDKAFDLLLLDIEMARMNGVALARKTGKSPSCSSPATRITSPTATT